jgi:hypothetical protein
MRDGRNEQKSQTLKDWRGEVLTRGGVISPIRAVILRRIDLYRRVLESYSQPLLNFINWKATADGNVEVLNATGDYYRHFDATQHAEFLYACVQESVKENLPREVAYLESYDQFVGRVQTVFDVSNNRLDLLWRFLQQSDGRLSKRERVKEFAALTDQEAGTIEKMFREAVAARPAGQLKTVHPKLGIVWRRFRCENWRWDHCVSAEGKEQGPHLVVSILMRGLLKRLVTRLYFPDAGNAAGPILNLVEPWRGSRRTLASGESIC